MSSLSRTRSVPAQRHLKAAILHASALMAFALSAASKASAQKPHPQPPRIGSIGTGWSYQYSDQGAGQRASLNGWYLRPSARVHRGTSIYADYTVYYGQNRKGSLNSHGISLGLSQTLFPRAGFHPSLFARAGDSRSSNHGVIAHSFSAAVGASLEIPLTQRLSLSVTPAQYSLGLPHGNPRNSYSAKAGLVFPLSKWW